jgi:hypothetical protein
MNCAAFPVGCGRKKLPKGYWNPSSKWAICERCFKPTIKKSYVSAALSSHLLFVRVDHDGIPLDSKLIDKKTLKVNQGVSAFENDAENIQNIVKSLKAGKNKLKSIVFDETSQTLFFFCVDKEKKTLKLFFYDANNGYTQHKNSPRRPNFELLITDDKIEEIGMMGVNSGIVYLFIEKNIVFISLDSGELIGKSEAQKGLNWFDKANPGSFLNYK